MCEFQLNETALDMFFEHAEQHEECMVEHGAESFIHKKAALLGWGWAARMFNKQGREWPRYCYSYEVDVGGKRGVILFYYEHCSPREDILWDGLADLAWQVKESYIQ